MKKFREQFRRWRNGEEVEFDLTISVPALLLGLALFIWLIVIIVKALV